MLFYPKDGLVCHLSWKFLSLIDHLLYLLLYWDTTYKMLLLVHFNHLCCEIVSSAVSKFLYCINTSCLKKFSELRAYTLHAIKICMVAPLEDKFARDASLLLESLTASWSRTFFTKLSGIIYARCNEFLSISCAYAFDINYFVCHSYRFLWLIS